MPQRIPVHSIILRRDGKRLVPPVGKSFNFTQEELDEIKKTNPKAIRHPIVETAPVVDEAAPADSKPAGGKKAKGGDKPEGDGKPEGQDEL